MHRAITLLFVLTLACAHGSGSSSRPATIRQPDIDAQLTHSLFFGSSSSAPATIEVAVQNRANVPITVRRVEIDSPGMVEYTLQRTIRDFHETIPPGETKAVTVFATAYTTTSRPTEPLTIRAIVVFEAEGARWREMLIARP